VTEAMLSSEDLEIQIAGEKEPTILFVHGFCCDKDDWLPAVNALSKEFQCVTVDMPGHGASTKTVSPTMASLASAVNLAKATSGSNSIILVGHSLGAKVVREAYRQSSENVDGIVLVDGSLYVGDRETMLQSAKAAVEKGADAFIRGLFTEMFTDKVDREVPERVLARALRMDASFATSLFLDSVDWDTKLAVETIRQISKPVLVVQTTAFDSQFKRHSLKRGEKTPFMETIEESVPQSEVRVMEDSGHFPMIEAPEAFARIIAGFAKRAHEQAQSKRRQAGSDRI
jgi:pimeloyl-ACP methyl ester carboxylesterase